VLSVGDEAALAAAGVAAGVVGTAGGITSLISYPALLAVGLGPLSANVANIVALVACWPGSAATSRPELSGRGRWLGWSMPVAAVGGAAGAVLLRSTPAGAFTDVVLYLLTAASLGLILQPRLRRLHRQQRGRRTEVLTSGALLGMGTYNGYFGAGSGVMVLTLFMLTEEDHLARANALKNMVLGASTAASAVVLIAAFHVHWAAVLPLAAGMLLGSAVGPIVARRVPSALLRWIVALVGLGVAVRIWVGGA
jgi:uncharacterized protein